MEFQQYRPMITDLTDRIYSTADCRRHHKQTWKQQALQTEKTLAIKKKLWEKQSSATTNSTSSEERSKLLITQKQEQVQEQVVCNFLFFPFYLWLLRHARSPTMPGTPVSPLRSTATVMNYANPLVFVQSTMTQGCKQLTPGIKKKANLSASVKRDNTDCCASWGVAFKCNRCHCWGDI